MEVKRLFYGEKIVFARENIDLSQDLEKIILKLSKIKKPKYSRSKRLAYYTKKVRECFHNARQ